jgi:hypothetical protein
MSPDMVSCISHLVVGGALDPQHSLEVPEHDSTVDLREALFYLLTAGLVDTVPGAPGPGVVMLARNSKGSIIGLAIGMIRRLFVPEVLCVCLVLVTR